MPGGAALRSLLLPEDPAARRRRDRVLATLLVLLFAVLVARAARKEAGVLVNNQAFGARFLAGQDPYEDPALGRRVHGPYPPSYVLVCAPLALLPTRAARVVWVLAQCAALVALHRLLRRRLALSWPALEPHAPVLYAAALLLVSRYLLRDTAAGGGNLLYATLAIAGLELALAGRERTAGAVTALGLVLKPNLAPLLLFHLARGRWRTVLWSLGVAAVLFLVPGTRYGMARWLDLGQRWAAGVVAYAALEELHDSGAVPAGMPPAEKAMNQSLREAVFRLLRPPGDSGARDVQVLPASAPVAAGISRALGLALLAACVLAAWRARPGRAEWLAAAAFLPLSLLLSPITWKAHCVALLPLFVALAAEAARRPRPRGLALFLVLYYVLCDLLSEELVGKAAKNDLQAISVVTWCNLALLLVALSRTRAPDPAGAAPAPGT